MDNQNVLSETIKVLELMEESEEKVSLLRQELKQNESVYEQIRHELKALQLLKTEKSADLEDHQNLKTNIKEYNAKVVSFAQQIYSCGQELFTEIKLRETELDKIGELAKLFNEKFIDKSNKYKLEEKRLEEELENIKAKQVEEAKKSESKNCMLIIENEELNNEIKSLTEKIKISQNNLRESEKLQQREMLSKQEVVNIEGSLKLVDSEILEVEQLLKEMETHKEKSEKEAEDYTLSIDKKTEQIEKEIEKATNILDQQKAQNEELLIKINILETDKKEKRYEEYKNEFKNIQIHLEEGKKLATKELENCEKSTLELEECIKYQEELNDKFKKELNFFNIKMEKLDEEINIIKMDIETFKGNEIKIDLKEQLQLKQNEAKELKTIRHELKEKYNKKLSEIQAETKILQDEIDTIDMKNRNLQLEIDAMESEMTELKLNKPNVAAEHQKEKERFKQLERDIQKISVELVKKKNELAKTKRKSAEAKCIVNPKRPSTSSSLNYHKKLKIGRHWDSDSSVEGEDRRFSEMAKRKVQKMMKLQASKRII